MDPRPRSLPGEPQAQLLPGLAVSLAAYRTRWPGEGAAVSLFATLLDQGPAGFGRERLEGHFTASAWLVAADDRRVLLTHHRKLGLWLQLGGHADGDLDLARAALREAGEESGLPDLVVEPAIFDLDRHRIPAWRDVPEHWHYDVRYVVRATGSEAFTVSDESHDLAWRDIRALADDATADASVRRMARKWLTMWANPRGRRTHRWWC